MVDKRKENNERGNSSASKGEIMVPKVGSVKGNGFALGIETVSSGIGDVDCLVTYKRRRTAEVSEGVKVFNDSESYFSLKSKKQFSNRSGCVHGLSQAVTTPSSSYSPKHHRDMVLEQLYHSLENKGGLKECIQHAIVRCPGNGIRSTSTVKRYAHSFKDGNRCALQRGVMCEGLQNKANSSVVRPSNVSVHELNHSSVTEICRSTFFNIIMSEKFSQLCNLLSKNFQGMKVDKLLDLHLINSRMKEKVYESSPMLFHSDIQQVWMKLQNIGTDLIALAKFLSEKTSTSFEEQVGSSSLSIPEDSRSVVLIQESDMHNKVEQTEAHAFDEVHTCKRCGEKADGRNGLVCDSCEELYHISCVEPAVKEIPIRSWYCGNCTANGIESPHDNCVACERLNAFRSSFDGNEEDEFLYEENPEELDRSSNELVGNEECKRCTFCKICRSEIKRDEEYRICGHSFCLHKFYHVKCLTSKQLISYGRCWYCPSCLCRTCFTDRDDDKIVLCDGCDHAYHTYCMRPPRTTIPRGKWLCKKCSAGIQRIRKAKKLHMSMQSVSSLDGNLKSEEPSRKSGGVDMLLNAAKTLNYEENLAANEISM